MATASMATIQIPRVADNCSAAANEFKVRSPREERTNLDREEAEHSTAATMANTEKQSWYGGSG